MIDPKRIERLWNACSELKPGSQDAGYPEWHEEIEQFAFFNSGIPTEFMYALIRDKIVWWLANKGRCLRWVETTRGHESVAGWWFGPSIPSQSEFANVCGDSMALCLYEAERVLGLPEWKE